MSRPPGVSPERRTQITRRRAGVVVGVLALTGLVVGIVVGTASANGGGASKPSRAVVPAKSSTAVAERARAGVKTFLGPDGVESSAIIAENNRPGTSAWRIPVHHRKYIEGFADTTDAVQGEQVSLYVSTIARNFRII